MKDWRYKLHRALYRLLPKGFKDYTAAKHISQTFSNNQFAVLKQITQARKDGRDNHVIVSLDDDSVYGLSGYLQGRLRRHRKLNVVACGCTPYEAVNIVAAMGDSIHLQDCTKYLSEKDVDTQHSFFDITDVLKNTGVKGSE